MRLNFRLRTLLILVATACAVFAFCRVYLASHYQAAWDREVATLQHLEETFGRFSVVPELHRGMVTRGTAVRSFRIIREERRPWWGEAALLRLPNEAFLRTTQVVIAQTPSLSNPRFLPAPQADQPPPELSPSWVHYLQVFAGGLQPSRFVDWDFQRAGLARARAVYQQLSTLPDLEVLRPGLLFGDADLALFRSHPRLRVLCLLPPYDNDALSAATTGPGLLQLADGFPALKFVVVEDQENGQMEGVDSESSIGKLLARRPGLHIARYRPGLGLLWSTLNDPGTGEPQPISAEARREMDAAAELLNGIDDFWPEVRFPRSVKTGP